MGESLLVRKAGGGLKLEGGTIEIPVLANQTIKKGDLLEIVYPSSGVTGGQAYVPSIRQTTILSDLDLTQYGEFEVVKINENKILIMYVKGASNSLFYRIGTKKGYEITFGNIISVPLTMNLNTSTINRKIFTVNMLNDKIGGILFRNTNVSSNTISFTPFRFENDLLVLGGTFITGIGNNGGSQVYHAMKLVPTNSLTTIVNTNPAFAIDQDSNFFGIFVFSNNSIFYMSSARINEETLAVTFLNASDGSIRVDSSIPLINAFALDVRYVGHRQSSPFPYVFAIAISQGSNGARYGFATFATSHNNIIYTGDNSFGTCNGQCAMTVFQKSNYECSAAFVNNSNNLFFAGVQLNIGSTVSVNNFTTTNNLSSASIDLLNKNDANYLAINRRQSSGDIELYTIRVAQNYQSPEISSSFFLISSFTTANNFRLKAVNFNDNSVAIFYGNASGIFTSTLFTIGGRVRKFVTTDNLSFKKPIGIAEQDGTGGQTIKVSILG